MLKSDHLSVGATAGQVIVWRFKTASPYDLLFTTIDSRAFYTKRLTSVMRHAVTFPHGVLTVAAQVAGAARAIDAIADLSKDGTIETSETCEMPDWVTEDELLSAVTSASQQALYAAPETALAVLEF